MDKTSETMAPLTNADIDGGPFFPGDRTEMIMVDERTGARMPFNVKHSGASLRDWFASLRDWFAGQALAGQLAFSPPDSFDKVNKPAEVAERMYAYADAMLAARSARVEG